MLFGKGYVEKESRRKKKLRKFFAWWPTEIEHGRYAWLCFLEESDITGQVRIYNKNECFPSNEILE